MDKLQTHLQTWTEYHNVQVPFGPFPTFLGIKLDPKLSKKTNTFIPTLRHARR